MDANFWEKDQANYKQTKPYGIQWGGVTLTNFISEKCKPLIKGKHVFEIGTGGGKWTKALFDLMEATAVSGCDIHKTAVQQTKIYEPRANVSVLSGDSLPKNLKNTGVEIIFTYDVLLHQPQSVVYSYLSDAIELGLPIIFALPDVSTEEGVKILHTFKLNKSWRRPYTDGYINVWSKDMIEGMAKYCNAKAVFLGICAERDAMYVFYPQNKD
jgi:hypothetical protein